MRGINMINLKSYDIFHQNIKSLKELSKDDSDINDIQYMTESQIQAVDFDRVKQKYTNGLGLSEECAASADALLSSSQGTTFVEFKNGKVNNRNIKDKARDSLLILCDILDTTISYTRDHIDFIVVYNQQKNPLPNQVKKQKVQDSFSREEIGKFFSKKAGQEFILFDLERYKGMYFRKVHTYSAEEFEKYLESAL